MRVTDLIERSTAFAIALAACTPTPARVPVVLATPVPTAEPAAAAPAMATDPAQVAAGIQPDEEQVSVIIANPAAEVPPPSQDVKPQHLGFGYNPLTGDVKSQCVEAAESVKSVSGATKAGTTFYELKEVTSLEQVRKSLRKLCTG